MAKKDRQQKELAEVQMDMTPMIDVVFNLIIFFMLITQMVTEERAELEVPVADQVREDRTGDKDRLVINIHRDGRIEYKGEILTWAELNRVLYDQAAGSRDSDGNSNRAVVIRGDIKTSYKNIQRIMVACARQKIFKISFSAKKGSDS